ncbi:hypothetical protein F5146DRAFT_1143133 [Armillaria mellea]|nr:hypothetical protein F5146DRAFT_1143133 [Armillaria mellea]
MHQIRQGTYCDFQITLAIILEALEKPDSRHQPTVLTPGIPAMPNRAPTPVIANFTRPVSPITYHISISARPVQMSSKLDLPTLTSITSTDVLLWDIIVETEVPSKNLG